MGVCSQGSCGSLIKFSIAHGMDHHVFADSSNIGHLFLLLLRRSLQHFGHSLCLSGSPGHFGLPNCEIHTHTIVLSVAMKTA